MRYLGEIVKDYIEESGGDTLHDYARFYRFGVRAMREINLDQQVVIKTVLLNIDPTNNTVPLPVDYIDYTRIGWVRDGQIIPFGLNNDLALNRKLTNCGNIMYYGNTYGSYGGFAWGAIPMTVPHTINGEFMGGYFGLGGGRNFNGYYRLDTEHGVIQFSTLITTQDIYFEYLSDIVPTEDNKIVVNPYDYEAVLAFVKWKHATDKKFSNYDRAERKKEYLDQKHKALMNKRRMTMEEIMQAIRENIKLSPKL